MCYLSAIPQAKDFVNPGSRTGEHKMKGPTRGNQIVVGALFEMITAVAVAGTAIAFFPNLKKVQ